MSSNSMTPTEARALAEEGPEMLYRLLGCAEMDCDSGLKEWSERTVKARDDILTLATALREMADEVERLREEVVGWQRYKQDIDEALNRGDGSYRP